MWPSWTNPARSYSARTCGHWRGTPYTPGAGRAPSACQCSASHDRSRSRQASISELAASAESGQWFASGQYSSQLISAVPR